MHRNKLPRCMGTYNMKTHKHTSTWSMYAHKIKGLNMDWNERWWIWTGNWWEWLHMDRVDFKISRSGLNMSGTGWEWAEHEWERVKNEWKWVGPPFIITLYLASCNANMKKKFLEKSNFHCTLVFLLENILNPCFLCCDF